MILKSLYKLENSRMEKKKLFKAGKDFVTTKN